ncbi:drug resistance protein [Metarhizium album ARSEF 1941]|uniref:Drug resistance protein n=1 Tax=Metarhizium album (strain ARSEF 1941) TaxID=1081103 RepID=A0A0B2X0N4_METAS|nr:drug resistance protein [Metarhizium album ARSEF 1941]KHN98640.1 drug resistance protein [Metarhizium album ARSEF 1941]
MTTPAPTLPCPSQARQDSMPRVSVDDDTANKGHLSGDGGNCPEYMNQATIERLGRQRPESLRNRCTEIFFVHTIVMSMVMSEYFIGGFNIVLPPIVDALDMPAPLRTWPAGVTNLTTAALLMPFARLGDLYGGKVVFLCGHLWLMIWSLISGFSQNAVMLIVCRAMQGLGSAAFLPAGLAILSQTYRPGPRKNFVFAVYGACACVGFYFGIFVGAVTAEYLDWRWYFWIGAMVSLVTALSGLISIPRHLGHVNPEARMDWLGVITIVPGLVLVVFALTDGGYAPDGWKTPYIWVTLILGILFLAAAVYVQGWVATQPLLPPDLFKAKYMKRLMTALFLSYGVFGLYLFYASFYIETVMHTRPILTAAWFTPLAVGGMVLAILGGLVLHIIPNKILMIISTIGFMLSVLLFALIPDPATPGRSTGFLYWAYIFPAMIAATIGVDITFNVTNVFITTAMPLRHQAAAGGLINSLLYLGIAFWLGIGELAISVTVQNRGGHDKVDPREQYQIGFWTAFGLASTSLCLVLTIKMGSAVASMTADERAEAESRLVQSRK